MLFTPLRVLSVGLLLIAALLFVLNPGPEMFDVFLQKEIAARAAARAAQGEGTRMDGAVSSFLSDRLGRDGVTDEDKSPVERRNYYAWSIYRADMNGTKPDGYVDYLGVAHAFVRMETPAFLRDDLEEE